MATGRPPRPERASKSGGARLVAVAAAVIAVVFLFAPLPRMGIWDPYELDAADLARRIAISAFPVAGAAPDPLRIEDAQNTMPTLSDLRMGELPFTSMALAFRLFGLHEWTGRLPLALWGLAGALAVYAFVARLVDRRAGLYALVALVTMPLYFLHARTMLGDGVTMAALALALSGLGGALLDRGTRTRSLWTGVGALGLVAGYLSRGLLIGVAVPALAVGLTALALRAGVRRGRSDAAERDLAGDLVGGVTLGLGVAAAAAGLWLLHHTSAGAPLSRALGVALVARPSTEATFDLTLRDLGHGLFPWSAFLPFAVGRLFRPPPLGDAAPARVYERETGVRVLLLLTVGVAFAVFATLGPHAGALPFSAPAALAVIAAIAIRDFERGAPPSRAIALGTLVVGAVLYVDLTRLPEKALAAFSVDKPAFPKTFEEHGASVLRWAFALFAVLVGLSWLESPKAEPPRDPFEWAHARAARYVALGRELSRVWGGNLLFVAVVIEAALVGLGAMVFFGRRLGWGTVERLSKPLADVSVNLWWIAAAAVLLAPVAYVLARDLFRVVVHLGKVHRALATMMGGLLAGGVLSFGYYPALAAQLSPKEAFETLARIAGPDEPLGLLGVRARAAAYYGTGSVVPFGDPARAFDWLAGRPAAPDAPRRWLLFKADDLPRLNSMYRRERGKNLPVLDGRSSQILLGSNVAGGAPDQNPLAPFVLDEVPRPAHVVDAGFRGELTVLGWEVTDAEGNLVDAVVPQTPYHIRFYYRVDEPISGTWKAFLHIDGHGRRYNGDHAVLDGRYPMSLWHPGDHVVDDLVFQLEPHFTPGEYSVFFGFFSGDTRYKVTRGKEHDDRVAGGALRVR